MVCKAWAAHLGEVIQEAAPSTFPLLAHQMARKDGEDLLPMLDAAACAVTLQYLTLSNSCVHAHYL